jgi:hypothetical protein
MTRFLVFLALASTLVLAACAPKLPPPPALPTILAPAAPTAEINQAYPTEQAKQSNATQTVSGFSVNLQRAWRDGKQVNANVCFTLPDASDWTVWNAHLEYGGQTISEFSTSMLSRQEAAGGQPGQRCDTLSFYVPPDANLTAASLTIESLGAYPSQDEYCSMYLPKIQQALDSRGVGITLNCADLNGSMAMQITNKPASMSQQQAEQIVYSDEFYTVKGPWSFPVTFSQ